MNTKSTNERKPGEKESSNSTTIRINQSTKEKMENLDFVRKHTFDEIINELIETYEKIKNKK